MQHTWKCLLDKKSYPFYIIKHNLGIIPIHTHTDIHNRLIREGYSYVHQNIHHTEPFSIYYPQGPSIVKAYTEKNDT